MAKQKQLIESSDFERMRVFQQPISIFLQGQLLGSNVIIQAHDDEVVIDTNGEQYVKVKCQFLRIR
ncbi:hypothetical protein [Paenibacillus alginolyticus]|uniref:DUF2642 domain-containing protein n=1 Tax=Paenibacillus alginolyticus TaxID=59839 RepID=A0ABT4GJY2_9BACL|nr:hypothetical protein [Paenibacillus alginolyticus]MCY9696426.1 hypothetical protein [Paenibacillus alginolyticus]MEC0145259.1 hypothetical protein [Paenibacillus alginolyticus]